MSRLTVQCHLNGKEIPAPSLTYKSLVRNGVEVIVIEGPKLEISITKQAPSLADFITHFAKAPKICQSRALALLIEHKAKAPGAEFVAMVMEELVSFPEDVEDD